MDNPICIDKINLTYGDSAAWLEGPGTGAGGEALDRLREYADIDVPKRSACFEIGFGRGDLIKRLITERNCSAIAVDCSIASWQSLVTWAYTQPVEQIHDVCAYIPSMKEWEENANNIMLYAAHADVSHMWIDNHTAVHDVCDFAFCTEAIEHLANPYYAVALAKRLLKHGGVFMLSFPMPEDNLGYGGGEHAHVYPGFLTKDSFERFMRQLYFKQTMRRENGSSAWYVFKNYKGEGVHDVFSVISGNFTEEQLYGVLDRWEC